MANIKEQEHKNRCYLFVYHSYALKCSVCGSKTYSNTYEYMHKKKTVKGFANYCPTCRAFFIYYGNYIVRPKSWEVLNSRDEIKQLSAEYQKICQRQVMAKSQKGKQNKVEKYQKYYEIPDQGKTLEYERLHRNKKARKSKERAEIEEQKIALIKKKLESKEQIRIQQLKEFEKKREDEFNRRLEESRRRSLEKKRDIHKTGNKSKTEANQIPAESIDKSVPKQKRKDAFYGSDLELRNHLVSKESLVKESQDKSKKIVKNNTRISRNQIENQSHEITAHDFVVRSSSSIFRCRNNFHKLQDIQATFRSISRIGTVREIEIPAGYCPDCNIYFILDSTFERIKQSGVPICRTMDEKSYIMNINNGSSLDISLAQESALMQFGYSVSQTEDLPMIQRRAILAAIVDYHVLTKNEVISYLDYFIRFRKNQKNPDGSLRYKDAIEKWTEDREFISKYKIGNYTKVAMKRIITNRD